MAQDSLTLYKLIVLYMLNKIKFKMTYSQINYFMLEKEFTNYMTLQQVLSDLQDTELIKSDTQGNRTYFSITAEGQDTLSYFGNRISKEITCEIDEFLKEKHFELKNESSITTNYYKTSSGEYEAELTAKEKDVELVNIRLSVPTRDLAETICASWYDKNEEIYEYLMAALF